MFINVINNINNMCNGIESDEKISLYANEKNIRWDKEVIFIINPWNMIEYEKNIQGNLHKYIEKEIIQMDKISDFQEMVSKINCILSDVISEINLDLSYKNILFGDYLKLIGLKTNISAGNPFDNMINLINALSYAKGYKLIILINANSYFNKQQLIEIIKQVRYNETNMLIIDVNGFEKKLEEESILWIDEDFCEEIY